MGQIATFLDTLHLTYHEVVYEIPYRNLIIMTKDKQHVVYDGEIMEEVDEATFFSGRANPLKS